MNSMKQDAGSFLDVKIFQQLQKLLKHKILQLRDQPGNEITLLMQTFLREDREEKTMLPTTSYFYYLLPSFFSRAKIQEEQKQLQQGLTTALNLN